MDDVTNLFVHRSAARRYAAARPYFHPLVAQRILDFTVTPRFSYVLDVACGTGQSSRALAEIAEHVNAIDVSPAMVAEAESHDRIRYHVASAEAMPFLDDSLIFKQARVAWLVRSGILLPFRRLLLP